MTHNIVQLVRSLELATVGSPEEECLNVFQTVMQGTT